MQFNKKVSRLKRAKRGRVRIRLSADAKLVVTKSNKNLYAQVIDLKTGSSDVIVASASSVDKEVKGAVSGASCNIATAKQIGAVIAKRSLEKNVKVVAFDRSGYKYHGCIKALADAAREAGLSF